MMTRMGGWEGGGVSTPHKVLGCDFHARPHQPPGPLSNLSCDVPARSHNIPLSWSKWFLQRPQHTPRALKMWYSCQVPWFPSILIKMMFSEDNTVTWCLLCVWYLGVVARSAFHTTLFAGDIELTKYEPCHLVLVVCGVSRASRSQGPIVALLWSDTFSITLVTTSSHFKMNSCHQFVRRTHMAALFFWFR